MTMVSKAAMKISIYTTPQQLYEHFALWSVWISKSQILNETFFQNVIYSLLHSVTTIHLWKYNYGQRNFAMMGTDKIHTNFHYNGHS